MASAPTLFSPSLGDNNPGTVDFDFSFVANAGSDPDETLTRGKKVASITYTATGKYTVTLDAPYYKLISANAGVLDASTGTGDYATVYCADEAASPLVLTVFTFDRDGVDAQLTSRRVSVNLKLQISAGS